MSTEPSALRRDPRHIVVMGVSGSGKSSVGLALSQRIGLRYRDGDDLHPARNVEKMRNGQPLTDDDRWPWLDLCGQALRDASEGLILGCSALRRVYRDRLRHTSGHADLAFVYLTGPESLLQSRMQARTAHYMPPALLQSQLQTLEVPDGDENAITISIDQPVMAMVDQIVALLHLSGPPGADGKGR
ncbi:gluconokinase [Paracoccus pacificus]|uniref:Gluconokinase n=1 Tax=Paracoccus pacificus TaxID=1463598 RepID=A0ABW4R7P2_9RHOB